MWEGTLSFCVLLLLKTPAFAKNQSLAKNVWQEGKGEM